MDLNIVLLHPEIPHNTGTIGRLCVGLDAALHIIRPIGFNLSDRNLRRAGLDYWPHLRLHVHDSWNAFLEAEAPRRMMLASTKGSTSYLDWRFALGDYVVFGSESSGLPTALYSDHADLLHRIPMPGPHARSINLANAAAIVLYEAYRQMASTTV